MSLTIRRKYLILQSSLLISINLNSQVWVEKASKSPTCYTQSNADLVIGKIAYIGAATDYCMDWYSYDPSADVYTLKAEFPDTATGDRPSFTIKDKGYVLCDNNHLWLYDADLDLWTKKADFPGEKSIGAFSFVIDTLAYIGSGTLLSSNLFTADFWSYNAYSDTWTQKSDCIFGNAHGEGFSIKNYGYFVYGQKHPNNPSNYSNQMFKYDPIQDTWEQLPDAPDNRFAASVFILKNKAYLGMGLTKDKNGNTLLSNIFYEFDPEDYKWTKMLDIPDVCIWDEGIGFSIDDKGYMGLGDSNPVNFSCFPGVYKKLFEYTHLSTKTKDQYNQDDDISYYPNPCSTKLTLKFKNPVLEPVKIVVSNMLGQEIYQFEPLADNTSEIELNTAGWLNGVYLIKVTGSNSNESRFYRQVLIVKSESR